MKHILLVDAGNSRLKWRLSHEGVDVERGSMAYTTQSDSWSACLPELRPDAIWVGSVAGDAIDSALVEWAAKKDWPTPNFVKVEREVLGLRVGYGRLSRLGVDRYLAMLGARRAYEGPLCVVDVGTAMTLDAIDARGMHKGGLIAPGPETMIRALLEGTANIADASERPVTQVFATDTAEAVSGGACFAAAALIDRFMRAASSAFDSPATLLITGGARVSVVPLLETTSTEVPDLVFDGLSALANRHAMLRHVVEKDRSES